MRKTKRLCALILSVMLTLTLFVVPTVSVSAATPTEIVSGSSGDLTWSFNPATKTLSFDGKGRSADYSSTADVPWQSYGTSVYNVEIGKDVEYIHYFALYVCPNVEKYVVDEDNQTYRSGEKALYSKDGKTLYRLTNTALFGEDLKNGLKTIKKYACANSKWLISVKIPDSVDNIEYAAFKNNNELIRVYFSTNALEIPEDCFCNCKKLETVLYTDNVEAIGKNAFKGCESLMNFELPASLKKLGVSSFEGARLADRTVLSSKVTEIPQSCFKDSPSATSLIMPDSVTYIGKNAFENASTRIYASSDDADGKTWCTFPAGIKKIDSKAFYDSRINRIKLNDGLEEIGDSAFESSSLYEVEVPDTITEIGAGIITDTPYLTDKAPRENGAIYFGNYAVGMVNNYKGNIVVREGTIGLCNSCFTNAYNTENITLPASLRHIPEASLPVTYSILKTIVIDENNPYFTLDGGILYSKDMSRLVLCPAKIQLAEFTVPDTVNTIDSCAFANCEYLETLVFPSHTDKVGHNVCSNCPALKSVKLPDNLSDIPSQAFISCVSLEEITLPEGLTKINIWAFSACSGLKKVNFPTTLTTIDTEAFRDCEMLSEISLPDGLTCIGQGAFRNCKSLPDVELPQSLEKIYSYAFQHCESFTKVCVPDNVSYLGKSAFCGCVYLKSAEIGSGVTYTADALFLNCLRVETIRFKTAQTIVGESSFSCCYALKTIEGIDSIHTVCSSAFYNCTSLTGYTVPADITKISSSAFKNAANITVNACGNKLTKIESEAFSGAKNLKIVSLGTALKTIGDSCFVNSDLKSVALPDSLTTLGYYAFQNCAKLETVKLETVKLTGSVRNIPPYCFQGCKKLKTVTIPKGTKYIERYAFSNCSSLEKMYVLDELCKNDDRLFSGTGKVKDIYLAVSDKLDELEEDFKLVYWDWATLNHKVMKNTAFHYNFNPPAVGDLDGNDVIDVNDVTAVQKYAAKLSEFSDEQVFAADADLNGDIDINDATLIQRIIANLV